MGKAYKYKHDDEALICELESTFERVLIRERDIIWFFEGI